MSDLGQHAIFIISAYAFAVIVIAALIIGIIVDTKTQRRKLAALEARGVGRRSRPTASHNS